MTGCEWNPERGRKLEFCERAHAMATVALGPRRAWHLCAKCAALPEFARYRSRRQMGAALTAAAPGEGTGRSPLKRRPGGG